MKWQEDDQYIKVVSYDKRSGYWDCEDYCGRKHMIDLKVGSLIEAQDDEWYVGKTFKGRFVPFKSFASELVEIKENDQIEDYE